jgi:hypothetical protein
MNPIVSSLIGTVVLAVATYIMYTSVNVQLGYVGVAATVLAFWYTVDKVRNKLLER